MLTKKTMIQDLNVREDLQKTFLFLVGAFVALKMFDFVMNIKQKPLDVDDTKIKSEFIEFMKKQEMDAAQKEDYEKASKVRDILKLYYNP